jgi:hypothetical protein
VLALALVLPSWATSQAAGCCTSERHNRVSTASEQRRGDHMKAKSAKSANPTNTPPTTAPEANAIEPQGFLLSANFQNTAAAHAWSKFTGDTKLFELYEELCRRVKEVQDGDMGPVEAMLFGQAKTLETIFTTLALRASANDRLQQFQVNLTLALKAQAQCRATLEALVAIKNPRSVLIANQANISGGHQQVNTVLRFVEPPSRMGAEVRAEEISGQQNGLLETPHGNRLDTRTKSTSGRVDPQLETVGAGNRTANR